MTKPPLGQPYGYECVRCHAPISKDSLVSAVEVAPGGQLLDLEYECECSERLVRARFPFSMFHLHRLFGEVPKLPYRSNRPRPVDESLMRLWAWEVSQLSSPDEFELLCRHARPMDWLGWRSEEAARRRAVQPPS